jgi:hypothetical protein
MAPSSSANLGNDQAFKWRPDLYKASAICASALAWMGAFMMGFAVIASQFLALTDRPERIKLNLGSQYANECVWRTGMVYVFQLITVFRCIERLIPAQLNDGDSAQALCPTASFRLGDQVTGQIAKLLPGTNGSSSEQSAAFDQTGFHLHLDS